MIQPKSLEEIIETKLTDTCNVQESHMWTINEVYSTLKKPGYKKLPVKSFNHVAREVISIEESRKFYVEILGFDEVDRPQLDCEGIWLFGYGLSVHLIGTKNFKERQELKRNRIKYFSTSLPVVDHIAFVTEEIDFIKKLLDEHNVFYKSDSPYPGMNQVFFFDPDGNVIEVSNCDVGVTRCFLDLPTHRVLSSDSVFDNTDSSRDSLSSSHLHI